jgi:hypothetical protein
VFGGVALEAVGYVYMRSLNRGTLYIIELTVEEFLEMAGMSIVLYGALLCALGARQGKEGQGSRGTTPMTSEPQVASALRIPFSEKDARKLLQVLALIGIALAAAYLYHRLFDMPRQMHKVFLGTLQLHKETSIPSWFLAMQFFVIGALFLLHKNWPKANKLENHWFLTMMGIGFILLSLDSISVLSEYTMGFLNVDLVKSRFYLDYPALWIPAWGITALALLTIGRPTLKSMIREHPLETRIMLLVSAVYIACRLILTITNSLYLHDTGESFARQLAFSFSVYLNMVSGSVFLYATLLCTIRESNRV